MRNHFASRMLDEGHVNDAQDPETAMGWYGNILIVKSTVGGEVLDFVEKDVAVALEVLEK